MTRFWKWWWTLWGNSTLTWHNLSTVLPPPLFANSAILYRIQQRWFNPIKWFYGNGSIENLLNNHYRLLLTPSNTNNQQLITRLYPKRTAHFTRLAAALLPLPNLLMFGNTILSIRPRLYWVRYQDLTAQLSTFRIEQDSSIKICFKIKTSFSFDGKINTTKMW